MPNHTGLNMECTHVNASSALVCSRLIGSHAIIRLARCVSLFVHDIIKLGFARPCEVPELRQEVLLLICTLGPTRENQSRSLQY